MIKIGGGWIKKAKESQKEYISVGLDCQESPIIVDFAALLSLHTCCCQ